MATPMPRFLNNPMPQRPDVESFDLTRNLSPGRALVTGDRSLTRNPSGRAGLPLSPSTEQIGSRGMTAERRSEIAGRRLSSAMRAGDMRATELLYRGPTGFGRGFNQPLGQRPMLPPPGFGMPPATPSTANNRQPPSPPPLMPMEEPISPEQALGMPGFGPLPTTVNNSQPLSTPPSMPMPPPRMPWEGQPAPGVPGMDATFGGVVPFQPLPPSTLNGATGVPAPPRFSEQAVGGMNLIVDNETGKYVNSYTRPQPPPSVEMLPVPGSNLRVPMLGGSRVPGLPTFQETPLDVPPADGVGPVRPGTKINPVTQAQPPRIQSVLEGDVKTNVQWNPEKNRWERVKIYNPGDPDDNGIPGDQRSSAPVKAPNGKTVSPFVAAFGNP